MYISIIALITAILALIGALGVAFSFGNPNTMGKVGGIFGILTFIFVLLAPIYFMTYEGFATLGFWNDLGGPGYGWYLMLIAAIIALISSIPLLKKQAA